MPTKKVYKKITKLPSVMRFHFHYSWRCPPKKTKKKKKNSLLSYNVDVDWCRYAVAHPTLHYWIESRLWHAAHALKKLYDGTPHKNARMTKFCDMSKFCDTEYLQCKILLTCRHWKFKRRVLGALLGRARQHLHCFLKRLFTRLNFLSKLF